MKVYVATYEHRYGSDVRVFSTEEGASAWLDALADKYWEDELPHKPKPTENIGRAYFDVMSEAYDPEYFNIKACEVES